MGLVQCVVDPGQPEANARRVYSLLEQAPRADVYLLPELWSTGYAWETWDDAADRSTPQLLDDVGQWGAARGVTIGGSLVSRGDDGKLVNRFWWLAADGTRAWYDKAHLFEPLREGELLAAGTKRCSLIVHGWNAALSTCFDLRFPEQYRLDALAGADLFAVVSAWPEPRCEALRTLARARAIENQAWLCLCNRTGAGESGSTYCGESMIVAPDGEIVCDAGRGEGVVVALIERDRVNAARAALPVLTRRVKGVDW